MLRFPIHRDYQRPDKPSYLSGQNGWLLETHNTSHISNHIGSGGSENSSGGATPTTPTASMMPSGTGTPALLASTYHAGGGSGVRNGGSGAFDRSHFIFGLSNGRIGVHTVIPSNNGRSSSQHGTTDGSNSKPHSHFTFSVQEYGQAIPVKEQGSNKPQRPEETTEQRLVSSFLCE